MGAQESAWTLLAVGCVAAVTGIVVDILVVAVEMKNVIVKAVGGVVVGD